MSPLDATGRAQTILLLGAGSDIGQAIVTRLVTQGADTVLLAGRAENAAWTSDLAAKVEHFTFDAADTAGHADFFHEVFTRFRNIDLVILAFGVLHEQTAAEANPELAVEMAEVNLVGAVSALLHVARKLEDQGSGRLIVLSSVAGVTPRRSNFAYGASKAGLDFLARGLAQRLEGNAVGVLIVRPGFVHTKMTAGLRSPPFAVRPERVADAVVEALARRRRVVWVPSIMRWVMVVIRLLPPRMVRRLGG